MSFRIQKAKKNHWILDPWTFGPWTLVPCRPHWIPPIPDDPYDTLSRRVREQTYLTTSYDTLHHSASLKRKGTATSKGHIYTRNSEGA